MSQHSMTIRWSEEDQFFLVTIPGFAGRVLMPCTHGKTRKEAIRKGEEVMKMYLEAWQEEGTSIPEPRTVQHSSSDSSRTDWAALEAMTDEDIDYSDIPPLADSFFESATLRIPAGKKEVIS